MGKKDEGDMEEGGEVNRTGGGGTKEGKGNKKERRGKETNWIRGYDKK